MPSALIAHIAAPERAVIVVSISLSPITGASWRKLELKRVRNTEIELQTVEGVIEDSLLKKVRSRFLSKDE